MDQQSEHATIEDCAAEPTEKVATSPQPSVVETSPIPRVGVSVIITRDGCVLVGKRKGSHGAGTYQLPGGHLEYGESWEECAIREVKEETGMDLIDPMLIHATNDVFQSEGKHYITIFMVGEVSDLQQPVLIEPDKCESWQWAKWENIPTPRFAPLQSFLKSKSPWWVNNLPLCLDPTIVRGTNTILNGWRASVDKVEQSDADGLNRCKELIAISFSPPESVQMDILIPDRGSYHVKVTDVRYYSCIHFDPVEYKELYDDFRSYEEAVADQAARMAMILTGVKNIRVTPPVKWSCFNLKYATPASRDIVKNSVQIRQNVNHAKPTIGRITADLRNRGDGEYSVISMILFDAEISKK